MGIDTRPSAKHPPLKLLDSWLKVEKTGNKTSPRYCHLLICQKSDTDQKVWDEIYAYIDHAHAGARQVLRAPLEDSLHPLDYGTQIDPAYGYPYKLSDTALQGFFGEIVAGIVAEHYTRDGQYKWEVPAYLFRTHIVAFQQLESMKQTNNWERQVVGRTGDDVLAFVRDNNGHIVAWLACEAKCTKKHSATLIANNHEKLSQAVTRPIDLLRLIEALKDYRDDDYSRKWIKALLHYWHESLNNSSSTKRCDFSMYVCGDNPKRTETWIPTDAPHNSYTGKRDLTSAELHLPDVVSIIKSLYKRMDGST